MVLGEGFELEDGGGLDDVVAEGLHLVICDVLGA